MSDRFIYEGMMSSGGHSEQGCHEHQPSAHSVDKNGNTGADVNRRVSYTFLVGR